MSKRSIFTTITPLPASLTRKTVMDFLHDHLAMIDLNPLVIERHRIKPPDTATADEAQCVWYQLTDKVHYLPGGAMAGNISYTACFNDLPNGLQTHCRAPMGVDIRSLWSLRGSLPGEPKEPLELGITVPKEGLYLREDVDLNCNFLLSSFVKKTLKKAHSVLVDRMMSLAQRKETDEALANQFPSKNPAVAERQSKPGEGMGFSAEAQQQASFGRTQSAASNHTGYSANSSNYPPSDGSYPQYPSHTGAPDPRASYASTASWSSYNSAAPGLAPAPLSGQHPPSYQQNYNYHPQGQYGAYPPGPQGYQNPQGGYDNKWHPQHGWYQPSMEPVEIASSEFIPAAGNNNTTNNSSTEKKKDDKQASSGQGGYQAYVPPARTQTFELP